ncbi:hypothetical protein ABJY94_18235 [Vibrio parahaemolyticus]|uniref:hypothetical protein n=1 Tax=Vibrio parahaemolyticus TaxID=670 RepID=UPI001DEF14AE|nr:hypothetical protein [Vibrio parahaemolyticus]
MKVSSKNLDLLKLIQSAEKHSLIEAFSQSILGYTDAYYPKAELSPEIAQRLNGLSELLPYSVMQEMARYKAMRKLEKVSEVISLNGACVGARIISTDPNLEQIQAEYEEIDFSKCEEIARRNFSTRRAQLAA